MVYRPPVQRSIQPKAFCCAAESSRNSWTGGLYTKSLQEDSVVDYGDDFGLLDAISDYESQNLSAFGQLAHDFSPETRLIFGLRAEYTKVEVESDALGTGFYTGFSGGGTSEESDLLWGGKLTLEHDLNDQHMIFASATRGYRAAGANVSSFVPTDAPLTYQDETLWNFETGLRSSWFEDRIDLRLTLFYLYRENVQLRDSAGSGGLFTFFTDNGEDAEHYGLEGEANWRFATNWTLNTSLGLLETEREGLAGLEGDRELPNAPSFSYSARLAYQPEEALFGNIEVAGQDSSFESNSHDEKRDAFTTVNASIGYRFNNWTLTVWGRNIFDEEYAERVFFFANEAPSFDQEKRFEALAAPRTFGITANYRW